MIVEIIDASIMNVAGSLGQLGPSIGSVYLAMLSSIVIVYSNVLKKCHRHRNCLPRRADPDN